MSKTVKDGKIITQKDKNKDALEKAKKKIKDKNYNVFSGQIQKDKNVQTDVKKNIKDAKIRKQKRLEKTTKIVNTGRPNENKRVLKKGNIVEDIGKVAALTPAGLIRKNVFKQGSKFIKDLFKKSDKASHQQRLLVVDREAVDLLLKEKIDLLEHNLQKQEIHS